MIVTHDQDEALEVADRVAVMNEGHIEQVGNPDEVYHRPLTPFVCNFLGGVNLFHGRIGNENTPIQDTATEEPTYVRPHLLEVHRQPNGENNLRVTIKHINSAGPLVKIEALTEWGLESTWRWLRKSSATFSSPRTKRYLSFQES